MKRILACVFCVVLLFAGWIAVEANAQTAEARAQAHVSAAKAVTFRPGNDMTDTFNVMCTPPNQAAVALPPGVPAAPRGLPRTHERAEWYTAPVKVFDNLYYLGSSDHNNQAVWAVNTSDGIILIDTGFEYTVEDLVTNGLKRVGLDPTQIKYAIMHHAHGDRYFGGKHLQDTYGTRLVMTAEDWDVMAKSNEPAELKPRKDDMVVTDGMKLTLGDTTLTLYITPGHTPGTLSTLIPLKDGSQQHLGYILGGRGWSLERYGIQYYADEEEAIRTWIASINRFQDIGARAGADVFLSIHPKHDNLFNKFNALRFRQPGAPHPFVSKEYIQNHTTLMVECMQAQLVWRTGGSD